MIRGLYSAANGMDNAVQAHEVVAQNLAYANVPGYRQRGMIFSLPETAPNNAAAANKKSATPYVDFRPGTLQFTNAPLDFAVEGDAFFDAGHDLARRHTDEFGGAPDGGGAALVSAVDKASGLHAAELIAEGAKLIKGGGGKGADFAVAGGKDVEGIDAALAAARRAAGL